MKIDCVLFWPLKPGRRIPIRRKVMASPDADLVDKSALNFASKLYRDRVDAYDLAQEVILRVRSQSLDLLGPLRSPTLFSVN